MKRTRGNAFDDEDRTYKPAVVTIGIDGTHKTGVIPLFSPIEWISGVLKHPLTEKDLSENETGVLIFIAKREKATQYEISKEKKLSPQLVHHIFKELCKKSLIYKIGEEKSSRNVVKKIYTNTLAGLLYAYTKEPKDPCILQKLGKLFPLIIGKRDLFKRYQIDYILMDSFDHFIAGMWGLFAYQISREEFKKKLSRGEFEKKVIEDSTEGFFSELLFFGSPKNRLWRKVTGTEGDEIEMICEAIATDNELCEFVYPIIERFYEWHDGLKNVFGEVKRMMKNRTKKITRTARGNKSSAK
jgi:hypothetical protein